MTLHPKKSFTLSCHLPKILITELISTWFKNEHSMFITVKLDTLSARIVFLKYVFNHLKHKKDHSAEHDVTGILAKIQTIFQIEAMIHAIH